MGTMRALIPFLAAMLSFGAVAGIIFVFGQFLATQAQVQRRLPVSAGKTGVSADDRLSLLQAFVTRHFSERRFGVDATLRGKLRRELLRAGYFRDDALNFYLFFRMALPVVLPSAAYLIVLFFIDGAPWYLKFLVVCATLAVAVLGPDIYLDRRQRRLARQYRDLFPDFLDLLVVCIDAGLSLEAALERVTRQIIKQSRPLGLNLMIMASETRAGRNTIDALDTLADRLIIDEARSLVLVLRQSLQLGSDVGDTLGVFAEEMRDRRVLRAEENANKLPVKMTIPLALFIFPVVLIVVMFPIVIRVMKVFVR
jgi:tight adherence protein C